MSFMLQILWLMVFQKMQLNASILVITICMNQLSLGGMVKTKVFLAGNTLFHKAGCQLT